MAVLDAVLGLEAVLALAAEFLVLEVQVVAELEEEELLQFAEVELPQS